MTDKRYWAAGWNMPGYLPEMDVQYFDNHDEACEFIRDQFEWLHESQADSDAWAPGMDYFSDLREDYEKLCDYGGGAYSAPDGYWYWVDDIDEETYRLNTEDEL